MKDKKEFLIIVALLSSHVAMLVVLGDPTILKMGTAAVAAGVIHGIKKNRKKVLR